MILMQSINRGILLPFLLYDSREHNLTNRCLQNILNKLRWVDPRGKDPMFDILSIDFAFVFNPNLLFYQLNYIKIIKIVLVHNIIYCDT